MKGLSPKQKQVLGILEDAVREGEHLTVREIGDRIGVSSTCTVHQHLKALERKGYLKPTNHKHRAIELTAPPRPTIMIPFCGCATTGEAGAPSTIEAESVLFPTDMVGLGERMLFEVRGDGLTDASIRDGDLVVVCPEQQAAEGDVVVATTGGSTQIKRFAATGEVAPADGQGTAPATNGEGVLGRVMLVVRRL